jgi:hypothetical protein
MSHFERDGGANEVPTRLKRTLAVRGTEGFSLKDSIYSTELKCIYDRRLIFKQRTIFEWGNTARVANGHNHSRGLS